ncbi:hypothetical protein HK098_006958, partial [Nowakowskiella sp. JEL0407]
QSILRLIPIVGSVLSWFSPEPPKSAVTRSFTFSSGFTTSPLPIVVKNDVSATTSPTAPIEVKDTLDTEPVNVAETDKHASSDPKQSSDAIVSDATVNVSEGDKVDKTEVNDQLDENVKVESEALHSEESLKDSAIENV